MEFATNGYFSSGSSLSAPPPLPPSSGFPFQFFKCNSESFSQREVLKFCAVSGDEMGKNLSKLFSFYLRLYLQQSAEHYHFMVSLIYCSAQAVNAI